MLVRQLQHKDKDTIIWEMIDFVKCIVNKVPTYALKNNPMLSFKTELCESTGELGKSIAYYKGLKFTVFEPTNAYPLGRITFEGSLHKYGNDGRHNYNDFGHSCVMEVLSDLKSKFGICPNHFVLKQLEIGVNIKPPIPSKAIIRGCFLHGTNRFGWQSLMSRNGAYIQVQGSRKTIKLYDKAQQYANKGYDIPNDILRIEVKFTKMQPLNGLGIFSIADLLTFGLSDLTKNFLLNEWGKVLYFDEVVLNNLKYAGNYSNPNYWSNLAENNYPLFKYHRNCLHRIYERERINIKKRIAIQIEDKINELNV